MVARLIPLPGCVIFMSLLSAFNLMIWGDPWTQVALSAGGTLLPPPTTPLAAGQRFACVQAADLDMAAWLDLVGPRWTEEELVLRLVDAWIPCLFQGADLVATCVLRKPRGGWILETLRARRSYGTALLRAAIPWIYKREGPFMMRYTWELRLPALLVAWAKGWLSSAATLQYGWVWAASGCSFCGPVPWAPIGPRLGLPTLFQDASGSAIISDSGLGDGGGHICLFRGAPDWSKAAKRGGWRTLWYRGSVAPEGFSWSGEFVVVGMLNYRGGPREVEWVTAEIA